MIKRRNRYTVTVTPETGRPFAIRVETFTPDAARYCAAVTPQVTATRAPVTYTVTDGWEG